MTETMRGKPMLRDFLAPLLALGLTAMLGGCATTQMNAEWRDPTFTANTFKGRRLLIVCRAPDETMRRVCEDQWASRLGTQGVSPVLSYSILGFPWASLDTSNEMKLAARSRGAAAIASMSLNTSGVTIVNSGPQVGVGIGGGSGGGYRGGGFSFGGIAISLPIGGATTTQGLGATTALLDAASGSLVWSGSASASSSGDLKAQVGELTQVTIEALRKAGLI